MLILRTMLPGFLLNCQPSEAYLTAYLKTNKHLTSEQLDLYVWPWNTYASVPCLLLVALLVERVPPLAVLGLGGVARLATRTLLLYGAGVRAMAAAQVTYALASAVNMAYFAYVYLVTTDRSLYGILTAGVHFGWHGGNLIGSAIGQAYVSAHGGVHVADLSVLFYASLAFTTAGCAAYIFLPPRQKQKEDALALWVPRSSWRDLVRVYSSPITLMWSLFWVVAYAAHYLIGNYYQTQFADIQAGHDKDYGGVEMVLEAGSMLGSLVPSIVASRASPLPTALSLAVSSLVLSFLYIASTIWQSSVYYSYAFNIAAFTAFAGLYAQASSAIGVDHDDTLDDSSTHYALVFTVNTFLALGLATIAQALGVHYHFGTSAYYRLASIALSLLFVLFLVAVPLVHRRRRRRPSTEETSPLLTSVNS